MAKQKMVIDCDTGVDDAQAIMMALSRPDVEVIAITCVNGNVDVDKVCQNTLRVLKVCDAQHIPVFRGCERSIIHHSEDAQFFHGKDGLGDHPNAIEVDESCIQEEHAVTALIRLSKKYPGDIKLVALAPLTNIGVALRMDPEFPSRLQSLVIMGGNLYGKGNRSSSIASEFNFGADPEAAYITLHEMTCPTVIVSWDLCLEHLYPWEKVYECISADTAKSRFLRDITRASVETQRAEKEAGYRSCDAIAMSIAVDPSIVSETLSIFASVELKGDLTRGMIVSDWRKKLNKSPNVTFVTKSDVEKSFAIWMNMVHV